MLDCTELNFFGQNDEKRLEIIGQEVAKRLFLEWDLKRLFS